MPQDISHCLVFTSTGLDRLRQRIRSLQEEKQALRNQFKALKQGHKQLVKELKAKQQSITAEKKVWSVSRFVPAACH